MSTWLLYLILQLDDISVACVLLFIIAGIVSIVTYLMYKTEDCETLKMSKIAFAVFAICFLLATVLPSTKNALIVIGADYVNHSERIGNNVDKTLDYFEQVLDKKLSEIEKAE